MSTTIGSVGMSDIGAQIAALLVEDASTQRRGASAARGAEEAAEDTAESAQVDAMRKEADDTRSAGLTEALTSAAGGVCSIAGGLITLDGVATAAGSSDKAAELALTKAGAKAKELEGMGKVYSSLGGVEASSERAATKTDEANVAEADHAAAHAKRAADDARDDEKAAEELSRKAIDFLQEYEQAQANTHGAALHRA